MVCVTVCNQRLTACINKTAMVIIFNFDYYFQYYSDHFSFQNVPFQIQNKWRMLAVMTVFFGSGFAAPFVLVRHQLKKK